MATILMTWELGGGFGHVTALAAVARPLTERGHRVVVATRDVIRTRAAFGDLPVACIQAPIKLGAAKTDQITTWTYAYILSEVGFWEYDELFALADAWRHLIGQVRPDLVLFDHSPTALLASRTFDVKRATLGTGFYQPPDVQPLPNLRHWAEPDWEELRKHEQRVLENVNRVLTGWAAATLPHLGALFGGLDASFYITLGALDCYGPRPGARYLGPLSLDGGTEPVWPDGNRQRILAYLKPFKTLDTLLATLKRLGLPTLIYAPEVRVDARQRHACASIRFSPNPLNMAQALEACNAVILNSGNALTAEVLLAGKPSMHIPLVLEQVLNALKVQSLGAGLIARPKDAEEVERHLQALMNNTTFAGAAARFASTTTVPSDPVSCIADQVQVLLTNLT